MNYKLLVALFVILSCGSIIKAEDRIENDNVTQERDDAQQEQTYIDVKECERLQFTITIDAKEASREERQRAFDIIVEKMQPVTSDVVETLNKETPNIHGNIALTGIDRAQDEDTKNEDERE